MVSTSARTSGGRGRVVAVLGPTNTGKTHLAIERLVGHPSGMIGFPLRLLARENYERIVRWKGAGSVALVTGEERIVPANPRWFVCTVEAMPVEREVAFLAVDEIQMCADRERGHVFTDRVLHARGRAETMFLGAETAKPLLRRLVPDAEFVSRPRFSTLSWAGTKKITRLPRRSAVVAFSAAEVYGIAEIVRRQRGGAAVVFGALSPRTRNAQVAMYQAGEVDFLVATDAIGMGLNMDIDHVAFAGLVKFDGRAPRRLAASELAQIAGRAGRHMANGTFGTTAELGALEPAEIEAIENHRFAPLKAFVWRNPDLDLSSPEALLASLELPPPRPELVRRREADDHLALAALAKESEIAALARGREAVRLLWDVCQIPDFRKQFSDSHAQLCGRIFRHLRQAGRLPEDWVANQVARLDRTDGDIDTLTQRIAHVRTWTYIANRPHWLADARTWQERTREIEDKLSDALHERLMQRFVDRRSAVLSRKLHGGEELLGAVTSSGEVLVEGQFAGRLEGFRFLPDATADDGGPALLAAANKALRRSVGERVRRLDHAGEDQFAFLADGRIGWQGHAVARLMPGEAPLRPRVEALAADLLEPQHRETVRRRLAAWVQPAIERDLGPLVRLERSGLAGTAAGIAFELSAHLGCVARQSVAAQIAALAPEDRSALRRLGVVIGERAVFMPALESRAAIAMRALLWSAWRGRVLETPGPSLSFARSGPPDPELLAACGYVPAGPVWARASALEGLARKLDALASSGPFQAGEELARLIGAGAAEFPGVLAALGYSRLRPGPADGANAVPRFARRQRRFERARRRQHREREASSSPFALLGSLVRR